MREIGRGVVLKLQVRGSGIKFDNVPSLLPACPSVDVCGRCCVIEEFPLCGGGSTYRINEI